MGYPTDPAASWRTKCPRKDLFVGFDRRNDMSRGPHNLGKTGIHHNPVSGTGALVVLHRADGQLEVSEQVSSLFVVSAMQKSWSTKDTKGKWANGYMSRV
ncbi:hypothetical protein A2619_01310 [candidate division WWE3 bacterium RIFOXYD1_FULL_39_9]|uniref:Uncharacterized protein n=1 Tax=candidate division WWE3 bacterium RIFOXYD1_FULL_39_9 TaxID=1802649 RepID=A0A1F4X3M5_UNCKA|nr:MAG: hypothetical protein A2619_01310 [candidate division WWE3 bacterium RIFOXYD1_FULL_39_9]